MQKVEAECTVSICDTNHGLPLPSPKGAEARPALSFLHPLFTSFFRKQHDDVGYSALSSGEKCQVKPASRVAYLWTARNSHNGLHVIVMSPEQEEFGRLTAQAKSSAGSDFFLGLRRMFTSFPFRNMTYLGAILSVLASALWVGDGIFFFLAVTQPQFFSPADKLLVGGLLGFIGSTISVAGSILHWLECVNAPRGNCFGWAIREARDGTKGKNLRLVPEGCQHVPPTDSNGASIVEKAWTHQPYDNTVYFLTKGKHGYLETDVRRPWCWVPTYRDFRLHYSRDIGFIACCIQLGASLLFYLGAFTRLPGIYNRLSMPLAVALYWTPKLLGAAGFIVASWLFMVETQPSWLGFNLSRLGWHAGAWSVLGAIGFILGPCMSLSTSNWAQYQSAVATIWAGSAFLVASALGWYSSLGPYVLYVQNIEMC